MTRAMWDRLAAAAGMISVAFFVVAAFVYGDAPNVSDSAETIARFYADNSDRVLWAVFLQGFGVLALIWFTAAFMSAMKDAGEARLASAFGISFAVALMLGSVAALLRASLAFTIAEDANPETVRAFFDMGALVDTSQNVISAGIFLAAAGAVIRTKFLPVWWGWVSVAAAVWAMASATAWNRDGFWSPDGAGYVNFVVYVAWVGISSGLLTMSLSKRTT